MRFRAKILCCFAALLPLSVTSYGIDRAWVQQNGNSASQWGPTSISPQTLAARTDQELHSLRHTVVVYSYRFRLDVGTGTMAGMAAIKDQHTFRVEAPTVGATEREGPIFNTRVSSGSQVTTYSVNDVKKFTTRPYTGQSLLPTNLTASWLRGNIRYLFSAIGTTGNPLESLVKSAQSTPGFEVVSNERTVQIHGASIKQYRLLVQHTPAMEKKVGALYYEIVIDSKYYLPITMENLLRPGGAMKVKSGPKSYFTTMNLTNWNLHASEYPARSFDRKFAHVDARTLQKQMEDKLQKQMK